MPLKRHIERKRVEVWDHGTGQVSRGGEGVPPDRLGTFLNKVAGGKAAAPLEMKEFVERKLENQPLTRAEVKSVMDVYEANKSGAREITNLKIARTKKFPLWIRIMHGNGKAIEIYKSPKGHWFWKKSRG